MSTEEFRCGRVTLVGRTNSGKSTLLNRIVGEKVAIVSARPQTTRQVIVGVLNEPLAQLVFVDTPGLHVPQHALNRRMLESTFAALQDVDALVLVIDASDRIGRGDAFAARKVRESGLPFVLALNKVDAVKPKERLLPVIERLHRESGARAIVPLSARNGTGVPGLLDELRALLPVAPPCYPRDLTSDQTERFYVAELIREKVLEATRQEVPHATAVLIDAIRESRRRDGKSVMVVQASLAVEKPNQKGILIGRGGSMLTRIGTAARKDVEEQLGVACHLELFVKVLPRWRDDRRVLAEVLADGRAAPPLPDLDELGEEEPDPLPRVEGLARGLP